MTFRNDDFRIEFEGLEKLQHNSRRLPEIIREEVRRGLLESADAIRDEARSLAVGSIEPSIQSDVDKRRFPTFSMVWTDHLAAKFKEFGTGLFGPNRKRIFPKTKRFMRWIGEDGAVVFARSTRGQRAEPFFFGAPGRAKRTIDRIWRNKMRNIDRRWRK